MNTIAPVFEKKLAAMKSAALSADLHITIGCGCWYMYGPDVDTARRLCPGLVAVKNFGETGGPEVLQGEVPVEKLWAFIEAVRQHVSVAVTDILPGDRTHLARHVMVGFFPKVSVVNPGYAEHAVFEDTYVMDAEAAHAIGLKPPAKVDSDWDDEPVTPKEEDDWA